MSDRTNPKGEKPQRLKFLEGLRGLAALYVVIGHLCSMADPTILTGKPSRAPIWMQWVCAPFEYGHLAVAAFIVLSGFCLQLSLFQGGDGTVRSVRDFFGRRARRILPAYYACLALSLVVASTVTIRQPSMPFTQYVPVTTENVTAHILLIHNLSPDWMYKINGVLWSIAIEAQLYLLFPMLVSAARRYGAVLVALAAVALTSLPLFLLPLGMKLYPWYAGLFVVGIASASLTYRPNLRFGHWPAAGWAVLISCFVGAITLVLLRTSMIAADIAFGTAIAALCYLGTIRGEIRGLSSPLLVWLGTFSYSLYLMHHPIQQVVFYLRPTWAQTDLRELGYLGVIGLPTILLGTYGFHLLFERPFLSRRKSTIRLDRDRNTPLQLPLPLINGAIHEESSGDRPSMGGQKNAGSTPIQAGAG